MKSHQARGVEKRKENMKIFLMTFHFVGREIDDDDVFDGE
jgi:hypothetical protein